MKFYRLLLTLFALNVSLIHSQSSSEYNHELNIGLLSIEGNSITYFNMLEPKVGLDVMYSKKIYKGSWNTNVSFGSNVINDKCRNCTDVPTSRGALTEFYFSTGFRFLMFKPSRFKLNPFLDIGGYYSRMRYSGHFVGGWGLSHNVDDKYNVGGGEIKTGVLFYPYERLFFTYSASVRIGKGVKKSEYSYNPKMITNSGAYSILNLSIGYQF